MKLTITGKKLDTQAFANVLSQGEKGVEYVEIVADRFYEGTDLSALTWEMWGTYTRYESTAELAVPCVADGDDKVTFTWQPNEFYTIYPGPEELTLVGSDADGNKILKIVGTTPILVRENERKTSSIIIPAQVSNIEQAVNQCTQSSTAAASSAGAAATSAAAAQTAQTAAEAAQATAETEAAAAAASAAQALQISQQNKGWYPSAEALTAAHPTGQNGDWALVGGDIDTIWMWDSDGAAWKNTNQQIDLSNYYTKTQADAQKAEIETQIQEVNTLVTDIITGMSVQLGVPFLTGGIDKDTNKPIWGLVQDHTFANLAAGFNAAFQISGVTKFVFPVMFAEKFGTDLVSGPLPIGSNASIVSAQGAVSRNEVEVFLWGSAVSTSTSWRFWAYYTL
jgi:hypothetical protein